jgi:predicted metal-dependent peptidase
MTLSVHDKLAAGRLIASRKAPYFRAMITSLVPHPMPGLGTIGVTKEALLVYDPEWIALRTQEEMGALYWHEVMHLVLNHHGRRGDRNPLLWNIAGDIFINDQGRLTLQLVFPPGGCFPEKFKDKAGKPFPSNLTSDEYYSLLVELGEEESAGQMGQGQKPGDWQSGQCGSGAGNARPDEPEDANAEGGRSESEVQQTRNQVAEAVKAHSAEKGKGRGNLPLGMDRWADDMVKPARVPWQVTLARVCRQAVAYRPGAVDYSYSRISRRQGAVGFGPGCPILPALVRPVPRVSFILDTSGSMSHDQLAVGISEAIQVLKACGSEITFLSCDYEVHAVGKVINPQQLTKLVKGGGGSSFIPAFEHMARMKERPQLAVFATDGDIAVPKRAPKGFDVIWLLIDSGDTQEAPRKPTTAYGKHIVVSSD